MTGQPKIERAERVQRYKRSPGFDSYVDGKTQTGLDLHMSDGTVWFHPYDGTAPRQVKGPGR